MLCSALFPVAAHAADKDAIILSSRFKKGEFGLEIFSSSTKNLSLVTEYNSRVYNASERGCINFVHTPASLNIEGIDSISTNNDYIIFGEILSYYDYSEEAIDKKSSYIVPNTCENSYILILYGISKLKN